jgi:hypothetical protein
MKNCELKVANCPLSLRRLALVALSCGAIVAQAATTNTVETTNAPAIAANTNANTGTDFPSFKIISDRNIFSANRSGRPSRGPARKATKVDTFTLVGTVDYSKGAFAIFDGSSSSFRKTVKAGDSIANFKITDVDLDHVTIVSTNGAEIVLHVGSQMRRVDEGAWAAGSGRAETVKVSEEKDTADNADATTDDPGKSSDPAPIAGDDAVLKRLMQKRKAEVKNESE